MSRYTTMFSPIKIGRMEIKNRVFMSPHGMVGLGIGTDRQVGYFEARAKGGAGMMVIASCQVVPAPLVRSEEHTSELQSLMRISYAVFCLKKKNGILLQP